MHEPPSVAALLVELREFGLMLIQALSGEEVDWQRRPREGEWSLTEVMCHLRDTEREIHQVRFQKLIASDNAFLSGKNPDVWVEERQYHLQDGRAALSEFTAARRQSVEMLEQIEDDAIWERSGRHAFFGVTSLPELLNLAVRHDRAHWQQINNLLR